MLRNLVTVSPPLCITETELRDGLQIIDEALDIIDQRLA
jgi:4-aminobutyrate aminotransferase-like enzyme